MEKPPLRRLFVCDVVGIPKNSTPDLEGTLSDCQKLRTAGMAHFRGALTDSIRNGSMGPSHPARMVK